MVLTLESQGEGFVTWDMMGHSHSVSTEDGRFTLLLTHRLWRRRGRNESVGCRWRRQSRPRIISCPLQRTCSGFCWRREGGPGPSRGDTADTCAGFLPGACLRVVCCPPAGLVRCAQRAVCTRRPRRQGCAQSCPGRAVACVTTQTLRGPPATLLRTA